MIIVPAALSRLRHHDELARLDVMQPPAGQ
jgi:hypothetical protein